MTKVKEKAKAAAIPIDPKELNKDVGEETEARERALDETIAGTFPASDPLSSDPNPAPEQGEDKLAS